MLAGRRERRRSGIEASGHRRSSHARRGIRSGAKLIERLDMAQAKRASRVPVRWRLLCWPSRRPTDGRADDRMGRFPRVSSGAPETPPFAMGKQKSAEPALGRVVVVSMKEGWLSSGDRWFGSSFHGCWSWSDAHVSMASSSGGSGEIGCSLGRKSEKGGQAARRKAAPRGANFSLRESMCQIAWESLRAMSTWATLAPRCFPSRRLVRW